MMDVDHTNQDILSQVPPDYWLDVCDGTNAALAFIKASTADELNDAYRRYPILILPVFPAALEALGQVQTDSQMQLLVKENAEYLKRVQANPELDARTRAIFLSAVAGRLLAEQRGDIKYNAYVAGCIHRLLREVYEPGSSEYGVCLLKEANSWQELAHRGGEPEANYEQAAELYGQARDIFHADDENYLTCLMNEANARQMLAALGIEPVGNNARSYDLCEQARALSRPDSYNFALSLMRGGIALHELAESGVSTVENAKQAVALYEEARDALPRNDRNYFICLMNEAKARHSWAVSGIESQANLERMIQLFEQAIDLAATTEDYGLALLNEANALQSLLESGLFAEGSSSHTTCLVKGAVTRRSLALWGYHPQASLEQAIKLFERARVTLLSDSPEYEMCLTEEVSSVWEFAEQGVEPLRNYQRALVLLEHWCDLTEVDSPYYATRLLNQAHARHRLAELGVETRENLELVLNLCERALAILPSNSPDYAACLLDEAAARQLLSELGVAPQANMERALELCKQARGILSTDDGILLAGALYSEAVLRHRLAEQGVDSLENSERIIKLCVEARNLFTPESPDYARCLMIEGITRRMLSELGVEPQANLVRGLRLCEQARAIFPPDSPVYARCLLNEAHVRWVLAGSGVEPRAHFEQALELYAKAKSIFNVESLDYGRCLLKEANVRQSLAGMNVEPLMNYERSLALYEQARLIFPPNNPNYGVCLMNEANTRRVLAEMGVETKANSERALELYERARATLPANSMDYAACLMNEAGMFKMLAKTDVASQAGLEQALELYEQARRIIPADSLHYGISLLNEGATRLTLSDTGVEPRENLGRTLELYELAAKSFKISGSNLNAIVANSNLGHTHLRLAQWAEARSAFAEAINVLEQVRSAILLVGDRRLVLEQNSQLFTGMVEACVRLGEYEEAVEYIERGRSRSLLDMLYMRDAAPQNIPAQQVEDYRKLRDRAEELEMSLSLAGGRGDGRSTSLTEAAHAGHRTRLFSEKSEVNGRLREMEEEIRRRDPDFFALAKPADLAEMKELARELARTLVVFWVGIQQTAIFFVRPSGEFVQRVTTSVHAARIHSWLVGDDETAESGGWMKAYYNYTHSGNTGERTGARLKWLAQIELTLATLYDELLSPVHALLKEWGESRAVFIPGGRLVLLPLHAARLVDSGGTAHYLSDEIDIVYTPSAWVLRRCVERVRSEEVPVLTVALSGTFNEIPFTRWEVESIGRLLNDAKGDDSCHSLLDNAATASEVIQQLASHPVGHLSCHGGHDFNNPLNSALHLAGGEQLTLEALLGNVRLNKGRLMVLSACESGIGYDLRTRAEEFLGLPAGFIFAGTRCVVCSLWSVPDLPTALLMQRLYNNLLGGLNVSESLKKSQEWLKRLTRAEVLQCFEEQGGVSFPIKDRNKFEAAMARLEDLPFAHPYYWAAFQVLGNPAPVFTAV